MFKNVYFSIADFIFCLHFHQAQPYIYRSFRQSVIKFLHGYIIDIDEKQVEVDFNIHICSPLKRDYLEEKNKLYIEYAQICGTANINAYYNISLFEFNSLLQYCVRYLFNKNCECYVIHGSVVIFNESAYIFLGKNGAGKSTIVSLLQDEQTKPFTDDLCLLRRKKDKYYCYSASLFERKPPILRDNRGYIVHSFYFIKKSSKFMLKPHKSKNHIRELFLMQLINNKNLQQDKYITKLINYYGQKIYYLYFKNKKIDDYEKTKLFKSDN